MYKSPSYTTKTIPGTGVSRRKNISLKECGEYVIKKTNFALSLILWMIAKSGWRAVESTFFVDVFQKARFTHVQKSSRRQETKYFWFRTISWGEIWKVIGHTCYRNPFSAASSLLVQTWNWWCIDFWEFIFERYALVKGMKSKLVKHQNGKMWMDS